MTSRLLIDVTSELITASVEPDGAPVTVPAQVHVGSSGAVTAGLEAAVAAEAEPAGLLRDVVDRLEDKQEYQVNGIKVTAELLMAHLLTEAAARATIGLEGPPDETVISHPEGWTDTRSAGLFAAASRAGIHQASPSATGSPDRSTLLTREEVEGEAPERPRPDMPRYEGQPSVFGADGEATSTVPVIPAGPPAPPLQPPATPGMPGEPPPRRGFGVIAALIGAVLALAVLVGVAFFLLGDDDGGVEATNTSTTATLVSTTATTVASTTTTSTTTTTTTTSAPTSSTTTRPVTADRSPGPVTLVANGLILEADTDDETLLEFGDNGEDVLASLSDLIGRDDSDSGYGVDDQCFADEVRFVEFGDLELVFVNDGNDTFLQWHVANPGTDPPGLYLFGDLVGVGDTIDDFREALDRLTVTDRNGVGVLGIDSGGDTNIAGLATSSSGDGKVSELWAGDICDRL